MREEGDREKENEGEKGEGCRKRGGGTEKKE